MVGTRKNSGGGRNTAGMASPDSFSRHSDALETNVTFDALNELARATKLVLLPARSLRYCCDLISDSDSDADTDADSDFNSVSDSLTL